MKRKYYLLPLFLLTFLSVNAQFAWEAITSITNDPANGQRYDDVFFLDQNTGWAANGFYAAIYKTTDGGANWTLQTDGNTLEPGGGLYFRNVEFLNASIGFIGTFQGKFYRTTDGGANWAEVTGISPNPSGICGIEAVGTSTVYGVGEFREPAVMIKSTDSGVTWTHTDMSAHATALVEVEFVDENLGYAAGKSATGGIVIKTTDGGANWTEVYNSGVAGEFVWKLQILEGSSGNTIFGAVQQAATSSGRLIKTIDAGVNWTEKNVPGADIQAVGFISETHGWMGGSDVGIMETTDGGDNWTNIGVGGNLNRIFVVNNTYAFGAGTTVYRYSDATLSTDDVLGERLPLKVELSENPVEDLLKFTITYRFNDNMVIELYDIQGKLIRQLARDRISDVSGGTKNYEFNVSDLSAGMYILNFHNNTGRQSTKFIKK
ncbi:T9SS type A sorting domain-containing protein [Pseudotenacibaculum sp. MALMAid0570]|uniref:T9SS type A sorting domain-containing protein n=1 Tax=Pseudotenacibaculum sp. MALMAid0570 TaxID=3143938 RepID=UPI0032DEDA19